MAIIVNQIVDKLRDPFYFKTSNDYKRIVVKDALISHILYFLYNHSEYRKLNFYGGTCAHVIYELNRLSEDIDLDNGEGVNLTNLGVDLTKFIVNELGMSEANVYEQHGEGGIGRWIVRVPILHKLNLSPLPSEKLHVKVEISSHKQVANIVKTPVVRDGRTMVINHFDLPSLMSGKMLACLERQWRKAETGAKVKGRDFYDLLWYMQSKVEPNEDKLASDGERPYTAKEAWELIGKKIDKLKRKDLARDLYNFLPDKQFVESWLDNFQEFYRRGRGKLL